MQELLELLKLLELPKLLKLTGARVPAGAASARQGERAAGGVGEAAAVEDVASIGVESSLRLSAAQHAARAARFSIFFASQRLDKDPTWALRVAVGREARGGGTCRS